MLTPSPAPQRPYAPPALVVHGDVQALTHKLGSNPDLDSSGSFNPNVNDAAPADQ